MKLFFKLVFIAGLFLVVNYDNTSARQTWSSDTQHLSKSQLNSEHGFIRLTDIWKFSPDDNPEFASPVHDDTDWEIVSTLLARVDLDFMDWNNTGWFRLNLDVDESLSGVPLLLDMPILNGEAEVFIDGNKIASFGLGNGIWNWNFGYYRSAHIFTFSQPGNYQLAVRFVNPQVEKLLLRNQYAGFRIQLYEANSQFGTVLSFIRTTSFKQFLFTGALIVFAIIHLLLFAFYPGQSQNLYFSLFTLCLALVNLIIWQAEFTSTVSESFFFLDISSLFKALSIIFFLRFAYAMFYRETPWYFWVFTALIAADTLLKWIIPNFDYYYLLDVILFILSLEIIRVTVNAFRDKKKGILIFGTGIIIFIASQLLLIINSYGLLSLDTEWTGVSGAAILLLSMSVTLSKSVAQTTNDLKSKLREVKELSEKTLLQERINREQEVSRRLLEADNSRKTKELEEARRLQLSMLPDRVPRVEGLDISVKMITASEVGGDYYDFYTRADGSLIAAVGDATGHGLKAGMVVTTVRSYFHTLAGSNTLLDILKKISEGIRNMNLKMLFMGLTLIKIHKEKVEIVSAGMSPLLHYSSQKNKVRELRIKGMPLGSKVSFPYKNHELNLENGDFLLVMSDGLIEAFNEQREQFSIGRLAKIVQENKHLSSDKLISIMIEVFRKWTGHSTPDDDITLMVIKKAGN
ncbi:MAG: SpoIIE family protein phosphatase [Balneolales bacterium]|nr:SpoIIE family protein phosphatase [Balneolales bacterium]